MASTKSASAGRKSGSSRPARRGSGRSGSGNGSSPSPVETVRDAVSNGAQSIASGAASKAKGPALTGGAAIAGLVGGMVLAGRGGRRRVLGVPIPGTRRPLVQIKTPRRNHVAKDVAKAAGSMGKAGGQMAELASEVRQAREQLDSRQRRSPIEVVLEGLTSRRGRAA
jgi:hypothetical protein